MKSHSQFLSCFLAVLVLPAISSALSFDEAFANLKSYDDGQSNAALNVIEQGVARASVEATQRQALAARLAAVLTDDGTSEAAKLFVCQQLRLVGGEAQVPQLARMLEDARTADMARLVLQPMPGEVASRALMAALQRVQGDQLIGVINTLGERRDPVAVKALGGLLVDANTRVASAAAMAIGNIGSKEAADLLASARPLADRRDTFRDAQLVCAQRLLASGEQDRATETYRAFFAADQPITVRVAALSGLVTAAGNEALSQLLEALDSTDPRLVKLVIQLSPKLASRESTAALQQVLSNAEGPTRLLALGTLAEQGDSGALTDLSRLAASNDQAVRVEAVREIRRLAWATKDTNILAQLAASATEPESTVEVLTPAPYADSVVATRSKEVAAKLAAGDQLLTYLDCGVAATASENGVTLRQVNGGSWQFPGSEQTAAPTCGTVAYNGGALEFALTGLDPQKRYAVGFSWWDYDNSERIQSVLLVGGEPTKSVEALPATKLPAFSGSKLGPAIGSLPIAPGLAAKGKLRVAFQQRAGPNATVSELWLVETQAGNTAATQASLSTGESVTTATPTLAAPVDLTPPAEGTKVLIVTGDDYPGHPWQQTAPALKAILEKDPRLKVRIVEDPNALASPKLKDWDVVVIHFMDWEKPGPGPEARENLKHFVESGKGMMLTHFACGAWDNNEWPEFKNLAGRAWDPKLRGHDPHGKFTVEIADPEHPITKGMAPFETLDELYTCLAGDAPIHVVATATSKVDQKMYPIAFVLNYGPGRVFHTVLGHDARAYTSPGVGELLRRGCAWAAGR